MCVSGWRVIWKALHPRKEINDGGKEKKKQHNLAVISEEQQKIIAGGWNKNSMKQCGAESQELELLLDIGMDMRDDPSVQTCDCPDRGAQSAHAGLPSSHQPARVNGANPHPT